MRGIMHAVVGLVLAAVFCQEPAFLQQYRQRLGGAIDELQQQAQRFDDDAQHQSLTRDQALDRLKTNPDPVAAAEGTRRQADLTRLDDLKRDRAELDDPDVFHRTQLMVRHLDRPLAKATLTEFVPAAPLDVEGLGFAAAGLLVGLGLSAGLAALGRTPRRPTGYAPRRKGQR